jgi:hypothetical protein
MNYNCPKNMSCDRYRCAHHFFNIANNYYDPVHQPCEWYLLYLDRQIRKEKLIKINEKEC